MKQILSEAWYEGHTDISLSMLYACPRPDVFPYYSLLKSKAATHPNFKLTCTVDNTGGLPWDEHVGLISQELLKEALPAPSSDLLIIICGPPPMCRAVKRSLAAMGYAPSMYYSYM